MMKATFRGDNLGMNDLSKVLVKIQSIKNFMKFIEKTAFKNDYEQKRSIDDADMDGDNEQYSSINRKFFEDVYMRTQKVHNLLKAIDSNPTEKKFNSVISADDIDYSLQNKESLQFNVKSEQIERERIMRDLKILQEKFGSHDASEELKAIEEHLEMIVEQNQMIYEHDFENINNIIDEETCTIPGNASNTEKNDMGDIYVLRNTEERLLKQLGYKINYVQNEWEKVMSAKNTVYIQNRDRKRSIALNEVDRMNYRISQLQQEKMKLQSKVNEAILVFEKRIERTDNILNVGEPYNRKIEKLMEIAREQQKMIIATEKSIGSANIEIENLDKDIMNLLNVQSNLMPVSYSNQDADIPYENILDIGNDTSLLKFEMLKRCVDVSIQIENSRKEDFERMAKDRRIFLLKEQEKLLIEISKLPKTSSLQQEKETNAKNKLDDINIQNESLLKATKNVYIQLQEIKPYLAEMN